MAIAPRKNKPILSAEEFISGAPDAGIRATTKEDSAAVAPVVVTAQKTKRMIGKKNILSVSMDPELVDKLDSWAKERGLSRAAALALATSRMLKQDA